MFANLAEIFFKSAYDSFIQVGVFVAITLLLFGYFNYISNGSITKKISSNKRFQVIIGALLGLTPGCGGTIMLMPLYLMNKISFGTVTAALIATMGDAAFVILVAAPKIFLAVSIICFFVAILVGYIIDYFGIGKNFVKKGKNLNNLAKEKSIFKQEDKLTEEYISCCGDKNNNLSVVNVSKLQIIFYGIRHNIGYKLFWLFVIICFPFSIMNILQIPLAKEFLIIGAVGTFFSITYTIISRKIISDDNYPELDSKSNSMKETLIHNAEETAFVILWVFLALLSYNLLIYFSGGEGVLKSLIIQNGYMTVFVAILVGLIPGCGPQIVLATLYVSGAIPFSALVANAISNDGDALFPLIALNKKSAIYATIYGLIPAFIVGTLLYFLGF